MTTPVDSRLHLYWSLCTGFQSASWFQNSVTDLLVVFAWYCTIIIVYNARVDYSIPAACLLFAVFFTNSALLFFMKTTKNGLSQICHVRTVRAAEHGSSIKGFRHPLQSFQIPPPPSHLSFACSLLLLLLLINARSMFLQVWSECTAEQVEIANNSNNLTESRGLAIILHQGDCYKQVVTYVYLLWFYFDFVLFFRASVECTRKCLSPSLFMKCLLDVLWPVNHGISVLVHPGKYQAAAPKYLPWSQSHQRGNRGLVWVITPWPAHSRSLMHRTFLFIWQLMLCLRCGAFKTSVLKGQVQG